MSDLGNMLNVDNTNTQPSDAVTADLETTLSTSHDEATELLELVTEDEGSQQAKPNDFDDVEKRRAAFAKSKQKEKAAKQKARELEDALAVERKERERLAEQLHKLSKPREEDSGWNDEAHRKAVAEWEANQPKPKSSDAPKVTDYEPDIDMQFALNEGDKKLKAGGITDVEDKVSELASTIAAKFGANPDSVFDSWAAIAEESGEDYSVANARYAIARNPAVLEEIAKCRTPLGINKILKREAAKIKPRTNKPLGTVPEPDIKSSGPIDNASKAIEKARNEWRDAEPHNQASAWQSYQQVKKQFSK